MSDIALDRGPISGGPATTEPHLGWVVAGLSAAAGVIHLVQVPAHAGGTLLDPIGFAAVGWFQIIVAAVILAGRDTKRWYAVAAVGNAVALGLWIWSRTAGLPFGSHKGIVEDVGAVDAVGAAFALGAVLLSLRLALSSERRNVGRLTPALLAVGALGLATTVLVSADSAGSHSSGAETPALSAHDQLMADIDAKRCDTDFNDASYWKEARYLGVDTYQGGAMDPTHSDGSAAASTGGHSHGAAAAAPATTTTTEPDPTEGRGSVGLDSLVSATSTAGDGEGAAAQLVIRLGEASDKDYDAWLWWLKDTGALGGHAHDSAASGDTGHGGHIGPQPWTAMTDPAECAQLGKELDLATATAMKYPTAQDAMDAGWRRVTMYVPGIAAHYMNFSLVDGKFAVDEPEMILYDGNEPDAHVVGLSYYILQDGSAAPTQGFTGANDQSHRHVGLCQGRGGVIGDSTLTAEECAARGGVKADGSRGWMSHAWVVPGCESPWGVFSAASPLLDGQLGTKSGSDDGGCAGAGVRDRYGLDDEVRSTSLSGD